MITGEAEIRQRLEQLGYANATAFACEHPQASFAELAKKLDTIGVQLMRVLYKEARAAGSLNTFVRDCLVRSLCELLPEGWDQGDRADFRRASAFGDWSSIVGPDQREKTDAVWARLKRAASPGWLPAGIDDPILDEAFADVEFGELDA